MKTRKELFKRLGTEYFEITGKDSTVLIAKADIVENDKVRIGGIWVHLKDISIRDIHKSYITHLYAFIFEDKYTKQLFEFKELNNR